MGAVVRGVILDHSQVLEAENADSFTPAAQSPLRRLQYSKIHTGISYGSSLLADELLLIRYKMQKPAMENTRYYEQYSDGNFSDGDDS